MIKLKRSHKGLLVVVTASVGLSCFYVNAGGSKVQVLRHASPQPECYQYEKVVAGKVTTTQVKKYCPDKNNTRPYWTLYTVGWTDTHKSKSTGPSWDVWFTRDSSKKFISEFELRQTASPWWNDTSRAPEEPTNSKRCALREVGIGFDWVDSGLIRYKGKEPTLNDFSVLYFGAEMKNTAANVGSTCVENPHDFLSLDFIYEYVINGKPVVSNAVHVVVSKMNYRDNYGSKNDDILYQNCGIHREYGNYVCQALVDASKWGIKTVGNTAESSYKNVNAEFLALVKNLESRKLLKKCDGCTWADARIRHLQIVNSTRGGARMVKVKNPFAWGISK